MDRNQKVQRRESSHPYNSASFPRSGTVATGFTLNKAHKTMFPTAASVKVFQTETVVNVFDIEMIREKILYYTIHDEEGKLSPKMVQTVRLVQKSWLETTTKLLQKSRQPVIELTLDKTNSLSNAEEVKTKGKLLDRFVGEFTDASKMQQSFLPFKLILKLDYFRKENYQSLMDCFARLGNELVELDMTYPIDGGMMPPFTFPLLRKLSFQFSNAVIQKAVKRTNFGDNESGFWLLQSILSGCKDLKKLNISYLDGCYDVIPKSLEFLRLPVTISCLKLGLKVKSKELEAIVFQLPNLTHLSIPTHRIPFEDGLFFKILERFQKTLKKFCVRGSWRTGRPCRHTYLRFPVMENLETIIIDSVECELGPGDVSNLQKNLPSLDRVEITYQTKDMLTRWLQNLNGEDVERLSISVVDEKLEDEHDNFYKSISLEMMTQVYTGFRNLYNFSLDLNVSDLTVLKCMFENMKDLRTLTINLRGNLREIGPTRVTSILLGLPAEVIAALGFLETFVLRNDRQACIRNLLELESLTLWTEGSDAGTDGGQTSLISDLLFSHGFLKMPKLRNLYLYGIFKPSPKMEKEWEDQGRGMKYSMKYSTE